jgi:hypothetical protein
MNEKQKLAVVRPDEIAVMRPRAGAVHVTERYNADELARDGVVLCGEFVLASDYDALYSTAIFNRKRYEEAESRIHDA